MFILNERKEFPNGFGDRSSLPSLGLLLFTLYVFMHRFFELYTGLQLLNVTVIRVAELVLIVLTLFLLKAGTGYARWDYKLITNIDFIWLPGIIMVLIYIFLGGGDKYCYFIYVTCYAFLLFAKVDIRDYNRSFLVFKYFSLFYALGSIAQYMFTDTFNRILLTFTSKYTLSDIEYLIRRNYFPGFGFNRTAVSAFYASAGLGYFFSFWDKKQKHYYLSIVITILLVIGLFVTGKRSILLWSFVALALTYIADGTGKSVLKRLMTIIYTAIIFLASFLLFRHFVGLPEFLSRIDMLINAVFSLNFGGSIAVRILLYRDAWLMFLENPVFGAGWNQFKATHPTGYLVHNIYIQFLAETGLVGFLAIVTPMFFCYYKTWQLIRESSLLQDAAGIMWTKGLKLSLYCQSLFLLYGLSDNPFYNPINILLYFLSLSIVNSYYMRNSENWIHSRIK